MLHALSIFTQREPYTLPLSPTLPDLKSDTTSYIHLQTLYKTQARAEKAQFVQIVEEVRAKAGMTQPIPSVLVDEFVKNCHQLKILRGKQYGDEVDTALREPSDRICSPCPNPSMRVFSSIPSRSDHDESITSGYSSRTKCLIPIRGITQTMAYSRLRGRPQGFRRDSRGSIEESTIR